MRWTLELPAPAAAPPAVAGRRVIVPLERVISSYALEDGKADWTADIEATGPLAATEDVVVAPAGERLLALDAATGAIRWTAPTGSLSAPLLLRSGWLVAASGGQLMALRASDGARVWVQQIGPIAERPTIDGSILYVSTDDGRVLARDLLTGSLLWERQVGTNPTEPLVFADRMYVGAGDRFFLCLNAVTGEEQWRQLIGAAVRGAPAADDSNVYFVAMDNLLRALHRTNGALRWRRDLGHRPATGPAILGPTIVVGGMWTDSLRGFSLAGDPAGELKFPDTIATVPAYVAPAEGTPAAIVAVTGSLENKWTLTAAVENRNGTVPQFIPTEAVTEMGREPGWSAAR